MPEITFWFNFTPDLQGPHKIGCVIHMSCHSRKVIFFWCFQLINMPKFILTVPNNFLLLLQFIVSNLVCSHSSQIILILHELKVLKGCVRYIFARLFLSLKESTWETRTNVFISLQKLFSFLRKSKFRMLDIQISWRHQIPLAWNKKYILQNNLESKHSLWMKLGQFMSYYKRKQVQLQWTPGI